MKILIFSPFAGIWKHEELQLKLANSLIAKGHEITILRCDKNFSNFCITMSAFGLNYNSTKEEKIKICNKCIASREFISSIKQLNFDVLGESFVEIQNKLRLEINDTVNVTNWMNFQAENIALGKIAAYEFFIRHKLSKFEIPNELFPEYLDYLVNTVSIYRFANEYFALNSFDRVIVYNRLYSINNAFCKTAEKMKIPTYSLQASGDLGDMYRRVSLYSDDNHIFGLSKSTPWRNYQNTLSNEDQRKVVANHFSGLFSAKSPWVYSTKYEKITAQHLRKFFKIESNAKIVLLAMSSVDELFAAKVVGIKDLAETKDSERIFPDQLQWIKFVLNLYKNRDDFHLIIRIHPRMFPNKRETVTSPAALVFREYLKKIDFKNVSINFPEDNISIYSIAQITDRITVYNSSVGAEFAALDIPVICFDSKFLTAFPSELSFMASDLQNYSELLLDDFENSQINLKAFFAFKWFIFKYEMNTEQYPSHMNSFLESTFNFMRRISLKYNIRIIERTAVQIFNRGYGKRILLPLSTQIVENSLDTISNARSFNPTKDILESEFEAISRSKFELKRKLFS